MSIDRQVWLALADDLIDARQQGEHLILELAAESSQFVRISGAKVRQAGLVDDADLRVTLVLQRPDGLRKASRTQTLSGDPATDRARALAMLAALRAEVAELPVDPYAELPAGQAQSEADTSGDLLAADQAVDAILAPAQGLDLAGLYSAGPMVRALVTSAGARHWFRTETFTLDFSLYTAGQRALKATHAGSRWDAAAWTRTLDLQRQQIQALERPAVRVPRGEHRAYLAPAAVADLIGMFSWGAIGEAAIRQGDSPLRVLREADKQFSPLVTLSEDFRPGHVPRFDERGELSPERLDLIAGGRFVQSLVSSRSALEYGVPCTGANAQETLRAARLEGGGLDDGQIAERLGDGLWLSNLHYLNWSDQPGGRITGMTRYACFQVQGGEITAPIEAMRWDESLFTLFGTALEDLTRQVALQPEVSSYGMRQLGGSQVPGALVSAMQMTL